MEAIQSTTHACSAEMNVDGNNHGPSYITALGGGEGSVHTRGDTSRRYQEEDDKKHPLTDARAKM